MLLLLPAPISIGHAGLAQLFFCITLTLALVTSPSWNAPQAPVPVDDAALRRVATTTALLIYAQILIGATMRHTGAGLAIPTFPLAFGQLLPPVWTPAIAIHFAHRAGALLVIGAIFATAVHVWRHHRDRRELLRPAMLLVLLVCSQATLGALVVLSGLHPVVNTAHVVNGVLVLGTALVLALRAHRIARVPTVAGAQAQKAITDTGSQSALDSLRGLGGVRQ